MKYGRLNRAFWKVFGWRYYEWVTFPDSTISLWLKTAELTREFLDTFPDANQTLHQFRDQSAFVKKLKPWQWFGFRLRVYKLVCAHEQ
jgi:hypothetical protein